MSHVDIDTDLAAAYLTRQLSVVGGLHEVTRDGDTVTYRQLINGALVTVTLAVTVTRYDGAAWLEDVKENPVEGDK